MKMVVIIGMLLTVSVGFAKNKPEEFSLVITEKGFEPSSLKVKAGEPVVLKVTRKTNATCAREITVPSQKIKTELPLNKEVTVKLAALTKGEVKFGCAMDLMVGGVIFAE